MDDKKQALVLGIDLGGTKILVGKMRGGAQPFDVRRYPTNAQDQQAIIGSIMDAIGDYLEAACSEKRPDAVGLGLVGYVDPVLGIWKKAINIPIYQPVPLCQMILERFGVPAFIDNDVHAAAKAELMYGAGREVRDFIYINIGTGISAGLVADGRLIAGALNYAGELGHLATGPEQHPCKCGRLGCLEPLISGGGLILTAKRLVPDHPDSALAARCADGSIDGAAVYEAAAAGDELAGRIVETARHAMERAAVDLVNLLNPAMLVFGGGAAEPAFVLGRLTDYVRAQALPACLEALIDIRMSQLDPSLVGLIGAGALAAAGLDTNPSH